MNLDRVERDVDHLLADGRDTEALALLGGLSVQWQDAGRVDDGRRVTERALASATLADECSRAQALLVVGELAFRQGDQAAATTATTQAQRFAEHAGDQWVWGRSEINLARIAFRDGDARRVFDHARRVLQRCGDDDRLHASAVHMLGWAEYTNGDTGAAIGHFEDNARRYAAMGDTVSNASELANVADLRLELGELDAAGACLVAALDIPVAVESSYLLPSLIRSAAVLAGVRGDHRAAVLLFAASEALYERTGTVPDPGDDAAVGIESESRAALGTNELDALLHRGRDLDGTELVTVARAIARGDTFDA